MNYYAIAIGVLFAWACVATYEWLFWYRLTLQRTKTIKQLVGTIDDIVGRKTAEFDKKFISRSEAEGGDFDS